MPASALDKSIPLKLSHQSQGNIEKRKKTTVSVSLSTHIPFKWPLAWPHPRPIVARIKIEDLRQPKQPRQTSALARVRSSHTQGTERTDTIDRRHSCPGFRIRLAIRSPHVVDKLMWQPELSVCVCVSRGRSGRVAVQFS